MLYIEKIDGMKSDSQASLSHAGVSMKQAKKVKTVRGQITTKPSSRPQAPLKGILKPPMCVSNINHVSFSSHNEVRKIPCTVSKPKRIRRRRKKLSQMVEHNDSSIGVDTFDNASPRNPKKKHKKGLKKIFKWCSRKPSKKAFYKKVVIKGPTDPKETRWAVKVFHGEPDMSENDEKAKNDTRSAPGLIYSPIEIKHHHSSFQEDATEAAVCSPKDNGTANELNETELENLLEELLQSLQLDNTACNRPSVIESEVTDKSKTSSTVAYTACDMPCV